MTRVGVAQADFHVPDTAYNQGLIRRLLDEADRQSVDILVLPDLASSGYVFADASEARQAAETVPGGPVCHDLAEWSKAGRLLTCGICEADGDKLYNSAVVFADGELAGVYRKAHLFMNEQHIFTAGDAEPPVIHWRGCRVGVMICYDWAFPEMARVLALQEAQIILHPSNLVLPYGQQAMVTRSIENRVFTATANRFGNERGVPFSGCSQITSPVGKLLVQAGADETGVFVADVDLSQADDKQITPFNHLFRDRKPELYRRLVE
jgi:beta-ureidopropionase